MPGFVLKRVLKGALDTGSKGLKKYVEAVDAHVSRPGSDRSSEHSRRVKLLAVVLGTTAVAAAVGGVFWPEAAGWRRDLLLADIASDRGLWWGLLGGLGSWA